MHKYRPWGKLDWLLSKLNTESFSFYGCLSTEERCLESFTRLMSKNLVTHHKFLEIIDPEDTIEHQANRQKVLDEYNRLTTGQNISSYGLLCPIGELINDITIFLKSANGRIVIDITSFPKRFFFPLIKILLKSPLVNTLIVTYTTPLKYSDNALSENPLDWSHIPMFDVDDPDIKFDTALIGLGFMPLGLSSLLKDKFSTLELKLMFPFPPGAPFFQRTWKFLEDMQITPKVDFKKILRVDAVNVSDTFDIIRSLTYQDSSILMAPYGPKTMSLAMCLYAASTNSPVYYTQPTVYDPLYSEGISSCFGYCVKLNNENLYSVTTNREEV